MSMTRKAVAAAAGLIVGLVLSGCGKERVPQPLKESSPFAGAPFVLIPAVTGKLVLRDANGKPLQAAATPLLWLAVAGVVFGALPSSTRPSLRRSRPSCAFCLLSASLPCSFISSFTKPAPSLILPSMLIRNLLCIWCHENSVGRETIHRRVRPSFSKHWNDRTSFRLWG